MNPNNKSATYIPALDGLRVIAVMLVILFHYWQQSWLEYSFMIPVINQRFTLIPLITTGYFGVELLFVLSGFGLYYPVAMSQNKRLEIKTYANKRFARIFPSFALCVIVSSLVRFDVFRNWGTFFDSLFWQLSFLSPFHQRWFTADFNSALWTMPTEVHFYLLLPLIILLFRKRPYLATGVAFFISECWSWYVRLNNFDRHLLLMHKNQLPGMLNCFVGGMLAAHILSELKNSLTQEQKEKFAPAFSFGMLLCAMFYIWLCVWTNSIRYNINSMDHELMMRSTFAVAIVGMVVCSGMAGKSIQWLLGNKLMKFISGISYQLYLWHFLICIYFKMIVLIPYNTQYEMPMYDEAWRAPYFFSCLAATFIIAIVVTYLFELPLTKWITRKRIVRGRAPVAYAKHDISM